MQNGDQIDWADTVLQDTPQQVFVLTSNGMPDAMDSSGLAELPTGIYTRATPCYSPYCQRMSESGYSAACYSPSCPNRSVVRCAKFRLRATAEPFLPSQSRLEREGSTLSQVAVDKVTQMKWFHENRSFQLIMPHGTLRVKKLRIGPVRSLHPCSTRSQRMKSTTKTPRTSSFKVKSCIFGTSSSLIR